MKVRSTTLLLSGMLLVSLVPASLAERVNNFETLW